MGVNRDEFQDLDVNVLMHKYKKAFISIDGAYMERILKDEGYFTSANNVSIIINAVLKRDEELFRAIYYTCKPHEGELNQPSGIKKNFTQKYNPFVDNIARLPRFRVKYGELVFKGWGVKNFALDKPKDDLRDSDHYPIFEQKAVDMHIGVDICRLKEQNIDTLIAITCDTDFIPAYEEAARAGIEVVLIQFEGLNKYLLSPRFHSKIDEFRIVKIPNKEDNDEIQLYEKKRPISNTGENE